MRVYLTALTIALGCIYWRVSGKLVEVVVRPGDNAILLCDREIVGGQDTRWVKICSSQIQPPLIVSAQQTLLLPISRFSVLWDNISKSFDLMIENITDADLGLYYCSTVEKQIIEHDRLSFEKEVYHTGDTLTKLTYASSDDNECSGSSETHHDSVSECWQCWLILLTVCPACSLFSASLAFLCGKSCYHKKGETRIVNFSFNNFRVISKHWISTVHGFCSSMLEEVHFSCCSFSLCERLET
ncbi:hypothetical protein IRJ41_016678 [Triplophysa rosa]|uniref:Immunoglobulin subtype domain-containing protein n=1 Tax=Triplophysa rosa TaxID=992332 RepID=A0A9W7X2K3_TRIRA|nr:hypothetical protein IRJ41_016678 [Triplophysa rosa]